MAPSRYPYHEKRGFHGHKKNYGYSTTQVVYAKKPKPNLQV